jgi:ammonium transporter Rh
MNLHGMPGIFGGVAAVFIVSGIDKSAQFTGIGITILVAALTGFIAGKIIAVLGRREASYDDAEEFCL